MIVFLFHHDLRMQDNTALIKAIKETNESILPLFILPPGQIDPNKNKYFSHPAVQFMCESLMDLNDQFQAYGGALHFFRGDVVDVLKKLHTKTNYTDLYFNEDYSCYALKRDNAIQKWCNMVGIRIHIVEDYPLVSLKDGRLPDGRPYTVLAQYYKHLLDHGPEVRRVQKLPPCHGRFVATKLEKEMDISELSSLYHPNPNIKQKGGRKEGKKVLTNLAKHGAYAKERDVPAIEGTTRASAHLRFGTISVREFYWQARKLFGRDNPLIRELVFRDFYLKIYTHWPELQRGVAYRRALDEKIPWKYDSRLWKAWATGTTGFPMVDAGMRQLHGEGWVHNRVRMLVASVPTRYFLLDWRKCAQYFYQHLVDADPFSNTAGWQWAAGIGVDSAPYFRAPFNPFRQAERFDKEAVYIKRWIPELQDVAVRDIHRWHDPAIRAKYPTVHYPAPCVDFREASNSSTQLYKSIMKHVT